MKKTQKLTIWLLPLIVIGGFFYPILGYLALGMMVSLLILSFFKRRYWCWNLSPRGAFLDIVLSKVSRNKPVPKFFTKQWWRWFVFVLFISFLVFRIVRTGGNPLAIGAVFVTMCLLTTIISIFLGVMMKHRGWCMICPMGTLQEKINNISLKVAKQQSK